MQSEEAVVLRECFVSETMDEKQKLTVKHRVCQDLPAIYEHDGQFYCLLHFPNKAKIIDFNNEFQKRLYYKDYDFRGVYFPSQVTLIEEVFEETVDFSYATFTKYTDFFSTIFAQDANFDSATFLNNVSFNSVYFYQNATFRGTVFCANCYFANTEFIYNVYFISAVFEEKSQIFFLWSNFSGVINFSFTICKGYVAFNAANFGNKCELNFQNARLENPERISFHTVRLQPNWFVNTDPRKFIFTDIRWKNPDGTKIEVESELNALRKREITDRPARLLRIACRQLADNDEENNRYQEASNFRRMAFECERLERQERISKWWREGVTPNFIGKLKDFPYNLFHWAYRSTSAYGEKPSWAIFVLLIFVFAVFPACFMFTEFQSCTKRKPLLLSLNEDKEIIKCQHNRDDAPECNCRLGGLTFEEAISHSLITATLQSVEYRIPTGFWGGFWVILEKIFAPVQAALLALAIRRKFMR